MIFAAGKIGTLSLPNRLVRSATAERMADADGRPTPQLLSLYQGLASGGVGLIITGHMYVHPSGKASPEMTGIHSDELIPALAELTAAVHCKGGHIVAQLNHGGMQCSPEAVTGTLAPSAIAAPFLRQPAREITVSEINDLIQAFSQAARRAREAGFDGVQIHGAHGYLISQFLSPFSNHRSDEWGGELQARTRFLRAVCQAIREQVGPRYPVLIKLGVRDGIAGGLTAEEGLSVVAELESMGLDAVEVSGGIGGVRNLNVRPNIRAGVDEAYFRPLAHQARKVTRLPILLVGGLRSRRMMEDVLASGDADFVSLSRPLLCEPDLPKRMLLDLQEQSSCISANRCWVDRQGEGIACKCRIGVAHRKARRKGSVSS